jgi:hypothetical protein
MDSFWIFAVGVAFVLVFAAVLSRRWRLDRCQRRLEQARLQFNDVTQELASEFLLAAAATGKPRGLRWKSCEFSGAPTFAIDPSRGELYALVAVTISFEAIEGGGMEEVDAVGNLRSATAVFVYRRHQWTTDGRIIFNLEPVEALARFEAALKPLPPLQLEER